jgi:asparagine synthase (glutamine-hydrolysing)
LTMCGIAGFWQRSETSEEAMTEWGDAMNGTLRHRGPDDEGLWVDTAAGVVLGHRRLAIVDLSPAGHQPMVSHSGRHVIVFNGEIYNYLEIRRELEKDGQRLISTSDTEVLVNACSRWGVESTLSRLNGMFAFALWDRTKRTLTLARDRLGKKPLYYGWIENTFLFGSELKALCSHPAFTGQLDRHSLALFLRLGYIPAPHSIYQNVYKLRAAHYLTVSAPQQTVAQQSYWCIKKVIEGARQVSFVGSLPEAADELHELLSDSIRLRMLADVPVGAFLSGGIDSSLIVALMQAQATSGVKTFTIGFEEASHNEAHFASKIALHLGTDHTQLCLSSAEASKAIPLMATIYDEPFADPSQIPTFLVSKLARTKITVSLSGDGADELFGGYEEYLLGSRRWKILQRLSAARTLIRWSVRGMNVVTNGHFRNLEQLLDVSTPEALHHFHSSRWKWPADLMPGTVEHQTAFTEPRSWATTLGDTERMMYMDLVNYLPEDILTKLDRASMAASLEGRVPFLDYRLVEFAWRLPLDFKIYHGQGKRIVRSVLARYVPTHLFDRPKMGFNLPLRQWLRGPLRPWVEELLDATKLREQGIFNPLPIRQAWLEYLNGREQSATPLWGVLMFQAWQDEWM